MKRLFATVISPLLRAAAMAWLISMSPSVVAQQTTVTFDLEDVWLRPDISHPRDPARQMTGSFEWTYQIGDFENGSGRFIDLYIPWYSPEIWELNITIEPTSIEFSLVGNYHDRGLGITLFLIEPFSPDRPAAIDTVRSQFEIQWGITYRGHAIRGSILPRVDVADVTTITMTTGSVLGGGVPELLASDDVYLHTRSGFGNTLIDLYSMEMHVRATTTMTNPAALDVVIESSISEPAGQQQIRLLNWNTGAFDLIGANAVGVQDSITVIQGIDAANYVDYSGGGAGNIDVSIKHLVFVPFLAFTFESFIDQVEIVVQ